MRKTNINYPHPVLSASNEDYVDCKFDLTLEEEPSIEGMLLSLNLKYTLQCNGLFDLINQNLAKVIVYFECSQSEFRYIEEFDTVINNKIFTINKNLLGNILDIKCYIVAKNDINFFKLSEHNKALFGVIPFNIKKGDILAISENFYKIPLTNYDPLADKPSIFSIRRQVNNPNEEISVNLMNHKITILLNEEIFEKYQNINTAPETRTIISSLFAIPVLVDILQLLKYASNDELENYIEFKWYQVITTRIKELNINLSDYDTMTPVANMILPHVFKSNLDQFSLVFKNILD